MSISSCQTTKTVPLETLRHDTLYINKEKFDSIYIDNSHLIDRGGDTIVIKDTKTEYRFRFLRDTIRITKRDSIPYEVRIAETVQVEHPPTLYDLMCKATFWLLAGLITIWIYCKVYNPKT